jgi:hypothetical protein
MSLSKWRVLTSRYQELDGSEKENLRKERKMNLLAIVMTGRVRLGWEMQVDDPLEYCTLMARDAFDHLRCILYSSSGSPSCLVCRRCPPLRITQDFESEKRLIIDKGRDAAMRIAPRVTQRMRAKNMATASKKGICEGGCSSTEKTLVAFNKCPACYAKDPRKGTIRPRKNSKASSVKVTGLEHYQQPVKHFTAADASEIVLRLVVDKTDHLWLLIEEQAEEETRTVGQQIVHLLKKGMKIDMKTAIPSETVGGEVRIRFKRGVSDHLYNQLLESSRKERRTLDQQFMYVLENEAMIA